MNLNLLDKKRNDVTQCLKKNLIYYNLYLLSIVTRMENVLTNYLLISMLFSKKYHFIAYLLLSFICLYPTGKLQACHQSYVQLDSVVALNPGYDVYTTLCIGGGVTGKVKGADSHTGEFGFGFYSSCTDTLDISYFTLSISADSTGATNQGINIGPIPGSPFGTEGFVLYSTLSPHPYLMCVNNPAKCGSPHQQCFQFRFRFDDFLPDSMRVFGVEGNGNAAGGCTFDADMYISFKDYDPDEQCFIDWMPGLPEEEANTRFGESWELSGQANSTVGQKKDCNFVAENDFPALGRLSSPGLKIAIYVSGYDSTILGG